MCTCSCRGALPEQCTVSDVLLLVCSACCCCCCWGVLHSAAAVPSFCLLCLDYCPVGGIDTYARVAIPQVQ